MPRSGPFQGVSELNISSTISQDISFGWTAEEDIKLASFGRKLVSNAKTGRVTRSSSFSHFTLRTEQISEVDLGRYSRPSHRSRRKNRRAKGASSKFGLPLPPIQGRRKEPPSLPAYSSGEAAKSEMNSKPDEIMGPKKELVLHSASTLAANLKEERVILGKDEVVVHNDQEPDTTGSPSQMPPINVEGRAQQTRRLSTGSYSSEDSLSEDNRRISTSQWRPEDLGRQFGEQIHCVMYRVDCRDKTKIYLDIPKRAYTGSHYHLTGSVEVQDLATFISAAGSLAYLVFRDVKCKNSVRWDMAQRSSSSSVSKLFWKEAIVAIDESFRSCIDSVAQCAPNGSAYGDNLSRSYTYDETDRDLYELRFFYHHREVLSAGLPSLESPLKEQVQDLLEFLQTTHGTVYSEADQLLSQGQIHRDHLEMLFCPNSIVVARQAGLLSAFVLRSWPTGTSALTLDCWFWGFDGESLHRRSISKVLMRPLKNVVQIRDLEVIPLRFATEQERNVLELRGKKFWSLRYQTLVSYDGWDFMREQHYTNEARCMIDYKTYRRFHPNADMFQFSTHSLAPFDSWPEHIPHNTILNNMQLIILPPFIHGFFLKEKKWVTLLVDMVGSVTWNKDAFERLVLPKKTKDLVKALVMVRTSKHGEEQGMGLSRKRKRDDLIAGKGNGLIMLLHGSPGTGKTLTAESVAEMAEMPLYNVTCGDIGTSADEVEKYLQIVLVLGKAWNSVLLLDEADVFLEERSLSDLERNSLVSVFLRTLEYYDGILILTSNRVGTFDEAFKSRIQVALHYPNLDRFARKKIWKNFFDMLEADEENVDLDELNKHMQQLADQDMNGREIRNALTTARQIALFQKDTLSWEHVEQAITTSRDFKKYLGAVHKHTDDQYARDNELR